MGNENKKTGLELIGIVLLLLDILIIFLITPFFISPVIGYVNQTVRVTTELTVGNVAPEVLNVTLEDGSASVTLTANDTKLVMCQAIIRDWNNETDINWVNAVFFNTSYGDTDDNNTHYTNSSCQIMREFTSWKEWTDDVYLALANCSFKVQYYANPGNWNCTVWANDTATGWNHNDSDNITINELLAVGLPDTINYGTVNATYVSLENQTTVYNFGNVPLNLSLRGYAVREYDNLSMNCTQGTIKNISIVFERYNLTTSTAGPINMATFITNYGNITGVASVKQYNLDRRIDETVNNAFNQTYWRMYVPTGVAGSCSGNLVFGATVASES